MKRSQLIGVLTYFCADYYRRGKLHGIYKALGGKEKRKNTTAETLIDYIVEFTA